ncbi:hypothetical protein [Loktanella sp. 3ANDIMAR09]|uniref:hypothetical protein n=1 Tax=Loktanella sp. 3ANDIMAR09 TaxID=1225657 RepID=UPI000A7C12BF|nr:hypothetical protein [Loktanella sp. 3ANDIMAR09]
MLSTIERQYLNGFSVAIKVTFAVTTFCFITISPANAQGQVCSDEQQNPIKLLSWNFSEVDNDFGGTSTLVTYSVENQTDRTIVAVDSTLQGIDSLDRRMFILTFPPYPDFGTSQTALTVDERYSGAEGLTAAARIPPDAITVTLCTTRIAFSDGTIAVY